MDCKTAKRLIPAYLDNEIAPSKATALVEHLMSCRSCENEMLAVKRTMEAVDYIGEIEPTFMVADIHERALHRKPAGIISIRLGQLPRPAVAAMVLAALAIGSGTGIYHGSQIANRVHREQHEQPVISKQVASKFIGLDAFDDGLSSAVFVADSGETPVGEVRQ